MLPCRIARPLYTGQIFLSMKIHRPSRTQHLAFYITMTDAILQSICENIFTELGPGHSESVYCRALSIGLHNLHICHETERVFPLSYKGIHVGVCRPDFILEHHYAIEIKSVAQLTSTHRLQLQRYLRIPGLNTGMLINFGPNGVDTIKL